MDIYTEWSSAKKETFQKMKSWLRNMRNRKNKHIEQISEDLTEQAYEKIDCLTCANCCKTASPIIKHSDIKRISKFLNIKEHDFETRYLVRDKEDDLVLNVKPCPFLEQDNSCGIYDVRPKDCESYPHTTSMHWTSFTGYQSRNIEVCPISFNVVKNMMEQIK